MEDLIYDIRSYKYYLLLLGVVLASVVIKFWYPFWDYLLPIAQEFDSYNIRDNAFVRFFLLPNNILISCLHILISVALLIFLIKERSETFTDDCWQNSEAYCLFSTIGFDNDHAVATCYRDRYVFFMNNRPGGSAKFFAIILGYGVLIVNILAPTRLFNLILKDTATINYYILAAPLFAIFSIRYFLTLLDNTQSEKAFVAVYALFTLVTVLVYNAFYVYFLTSFLLMFYYIQKSLKKYIVLVSILGYALMLIPLYKFGKSVPADYLLDYYKSFALIIIPFIIFIITTFTEPKRFGIWALGYFIYKGLFNSFAYPLFAVEIWKTNVLIEDISSASFEKWYLFICAVVLLSYSKFRTYRTWFTENYSYRPVY